MQTIDRFNYCIQLQNLLENKNLIGRSGKVFTELNAASTKNNLHALRTIALDLKIESTLEIGLAFGTSCLALAKTHQDLNHIPKQQHIAIDPYQSTFWDDAGRLLLEQAKLENYVDIREEFSHIILPKLLQEEKKFDLIYIDGSHIFDDVFIDFYYSDKLLNKQGVILFDDCSDRHIRKVTNFIEANFKNYQRLDLSHLRRGIDKYKLKLAVWLQKNQLNVYRKVSDSSRPWDAEFYNF